MLDHPSAVSAHVVGTVRVVLVASTFDETLTTWATLGAAVGTVGAFVATWLVLRRDHQRQDEEHEERLWDQALLVTGRAGLASTPDPDYPHGVRPVIFATVTNGTRRPISEVHMTLSTPAGETHSEAPFKAIGPNTLGSFECEQGTGLFGPTGYVGKWHITWVDETGRRWTKKSDGELTLEALPPNRSRWHRGR